MASAENITIGNCAQGSAEVNYLLELTNESGWDFSMYDVNCHFKLDPDFLFVAKDKDGTPVGFAGMSQQAPGLFYFGNFIVRGDLRGKGIGRLLWAAAMNRVGNNNVVLDGESYMADWYSKHGFPHLSYQVLFYSVVLTQEMKIQTKQKIEIEELSDRLWPDLLRYDRLVYPKLDRRHVLQSMFKATDEVRVFVAKTGGCIVGYGSFHKKPNEEYGIRNVFADSEDVLEAVLRAMFYELPVGSKVYFILLDGKPLPKYLKDSVRGLDTVQRMFSKEKINTNTERIWLPTSHVV